MARRMAPRISVTYAVVGLAWIGVSSVVVWAHRAHGPEAAEIIKGAAFVVVTAGLIYGLVRRGERDLAESNRQIGDLHHLLRSIIDGSEDAIAAWDCASRFTALNPRFQALCERLLGRRPDIGMRLDALVGHRADLHRQLRRRWDRALAGERFTEILRIDGDGRPSWYETSYGTLRGGDGAIVGAFHIIRDTTDRRRTEQELQEREQRLQAIIDNLADYVVIVGPELTARYYSAGITRVTGLAVDEGLNRPPGSFIHPDDVAAVAAAITACLAGGQGVRDLEYRRLHADGSWRHHLLNGGRLVQGGEAVFLGVVQDIDARREAEARLVHSAKLATVGEFAAGLAHELAHPVAVIRLAAESALELSRETGPNDPFLHEQIELVDDQARRMASLIEHIRAFSRKCDAPDRPFSPQAVIGEVDRMIRKQLEIDGIALTTDICDVVHLVTGSPLRLEEVVLNLISNARAAIRARRQALGPDYRGEIALACRCGADGVEISVGDNGSGIAESDTGKIFEPFFTTREVGEGLGLGLAISQTIVKSLGGRITFTSRPGATVFRVALPTIPRVERAGE